MVEIDYTPNIKAILTYSDGKTFKIPSQLLPLNRAIEWFTSDNTEALNDEHVKKIYNESKPRRGRCYTNARNLLDALIQGGVQSNRVKSYAGWMVIRDAYPTHHCFVVLDGKHVLDFTARQYIKDYDNLLGKSIEQLREEMVAIVLQSDKLPNSENSTFGKVFTEVAYFVSQCAPEEAMKIYDKLLKTYPNHICFKSINENGLTKLQQLILDKEKSSSK